MTAHAGRQAIVVHQQWTGAGAFAYYKAAIYEVRRRQRDGRLTWRFREDLGPFHWTFGPAEQDAQSLSRKTGIPVGPRGIVHGSPYRGLTAAENRRAQKNMSDRASRRQSEGNRSWMTDLRAPICDYFASMEGRPCPNGEYWLPHEHHEIETVLQYEGEPA